ncbi:MAG: hypothetical protein LAQ69_17910 [Acidobacteriia bacterium]|nr:hypothetical protein [Terriglobia bacterium]
MYELLVETFEAEITGGSLEIFYDGKKGLPPGAKFRQALLRQVGECDMMLACPFPRLRQAGQAEAFKLEIKTAKKKKVPIIPILFLGPNEDTSALQLGALGLAEDDGQLTHVAVPIRYVGSPTAEVVREAIRREVGSALGGVLIARIRNAIIDWARRDLIMYDSTDQVLHDLAANPSPFLNMFLYDGGMTIRRFCADTEIFHHLKQSTGLQIRFLYVDTNFKQFVCKTPEFKQNPELKQIDKHLYSPLYEALIRRSYVLHNQSPDGHMNDVRKSVERLRDLAHKCGFGLEVRKTCQLPFYRMMVTCQYVYYTQFLPTVTDPDSDEDPPEYHSLRLSAKSPVGMALGYHFDRLWRRRSTPHPG